MYDWPRYGTAPRQPKRTHLLEGNRLYSWQLKLQAVELFAQGSNSAWIWPRLPSLLIGPEGFMPAANGD